MTFTKDWHCIRADTLSPGFFDTERLHTESRLSAMLRDYLVPAAN